jgi:hypothetical protein
MAETHDPGGRSPGRAAEMLRQASSDLQAASVAFSRQAAAAATPASPAPRHEDELRGLMRLARQVTSILELQPLLEAVVGAFVPITEAERGFLMLYDADGVLQFRAAHNLDAESVQHRSFEISRGPIRSGRFRPQRLVDDADAGDMAPATACWRSAAQPASCRWCIRARPRRLVAHRQPPAGQPWAWATARC